MEEFMWRKCMTLVLVMATITSGQLSSAQEAVQQPGPAVESKQTAEPFTSLAQASMRYNKLRRGREEEIAISIIRPPAGIPASPMVSMRGNPVYFTPELFSLKADPGFTVRFGRGNTFSSESPLSITSTKGGPVVLLKLKAADDIPLGDHMIQGTLVFRERGKSQSLDVFIPISIVDHNADVVKNPWRFQPYSNHGFRQVFTGIALIPLLPFLFIAFVIVCSGGSEC
jgi:hypothetical protein